MRFECVKGPFVYALPMTLSGIVKGINTLRARAQPVNRSLFPLSFCFFSPFFFYRSHHDRRTQRTENKRRNPFNRPPMCLSIFLGLPLNFIRVLPPVRYIKASENCATEYLHCWQYIRCVVFLPHSSHIIFFPRVSDYFSNCYKANVETRRFQRYLNKISVYKQKKLLFL